MKNAFEIAHIISEAVSVVGMLDRDVSITAEITDDPKHSWVELRLSSAPKRNAFTFAQEKELLRRAGWVATGPGVYRLEFDDQS